MSWLWQVRPDGSRYIARRPTRTFLLRRREAVITAERSAGLTSDTDTEPAEVRAGKFWTRDQRRRHVEEGRERRRRQEEIIRSYININVSSPIGLAEFWESEPMWTCKIINSIHDQGRRYLYLDDRRLK